MHRMKRMLALLMASIIIVVLSSNVTAVDTTDTQSTTLQSAAAQSEVTRIEEVESLRETNSETYLMSDGSYKCVVYSEDKYYIDEEKELQRIDNTIVDVTSTDSRSFEVSSGERVFKNAANYYDVYFSSSTDSMVNVYYKGKEVSFSLLGNSGMLGGRVSSQKCTPTIGQVKNSVTLDNLTPTGDNTVTYPNAFPGTDLVYVIENDALNEYIVLNDSSAPNTFSFVFSLNGVDIQSDGNNLYFTDNSGATVFSLGSPYAIDANGAFTDDLNYSYTPIEGTQKVIVTVTLDKAYHSSSARQYPVAIESCIVLKSADTQDACVSSANPDTNYRLDTKLGTGYCSEMGIRESFIKFNIPDTIPKYCVFDAMLKIEKSAGAEPTVVADLCKPSWSSSTITWNNSPQSANNFSDTTSVAVPFGTETNWYMLNVTWIVSRWVDGINENNGFRLRDLTENDPEHWTTFYSSDAASSHKPELHITYQYENATVRMLYDHAYVIRHGNPTVRLAEYAEILADIYLSEFNILVDCVSTSSFASHMTQGDCEAFIDELCPCASPSVCTNSTIAHNGQITYATYHHTNFMNIITRVDRSFSGIKLVFLGQKMCERNGWDECFPIDYVGRVFELYWLAAIMNFESQESEIATMVHEFGHLYGVIDHYGGMHSPYSTETISEDYPSDSYSSQCIYGEGKGDPTVTRDIIICNGCKNRIIEHRNEFTM